jgi:hypothetical protein
LVKPGVNHIHTSFNKFARIPRYNSEAMVCGGRSDKYIGMRKRIAAFAALLNDQPPG